MFCGFNNFSSFFCCQQDTVTDDADGLGWEHGAVSGDGGRDVAGIDFHGVADAVGLLAGHEGGTGSGEEVGNDLTRCTGVADWVGHEGDGLHGGVDGVALGLVEVPNGGLFTVGVPEVTGTGFPSV